MSGDTAATRIGPHRAAPAATRTLGGVAALLLLTGVADGSSAQERRFSGEAEGTVVLDAGSFRGTPLLSDFRLRYGPPFDQASKTDHHVETIEVAAQRPNPSSVRVTLRDKDAKDDYAYDVAWLQRTFLRSQVGETPRLTCSAQCSRPLERPSPAHVFVLRGFEITAPGDRHIERIAVLENDGVLTVAYEHAPGFFSPESQVFEWQVDYAYLHPSDVVATRELRDHAGNTAVSVPAGDAAIRGFDFRFVKGDRHLREIAVMTRDGQVEVSFDDKSGDDFYTWHVQWAQVGPGIPVLVDPGLVQPGSGAIAPN